MRIFRWLFWIFAALYAFALIVFAGALIGVLRGDALAGVFLIPLGLPWVLAAEYLPRVRIAGFSAAWWAGVLAPALNLLILYLLARRAR